MAYEERIKQIGQEAASVESKILDLFCTEVGLRGPSGVNGDTPTEWAIGDLTSALNMLKRVHEARNTCKHCGQIRTEK